MKVHELIEILQRCNPNDILVMSEDGEGNSYSPLSGIDNTHNYLPESTWSGEIYIRELTPELERQGFSEDDMTDDPDAVPCVILWPTN